MSQLNFPANPDVGDPYEPAGLNVVYIWNGTVWEATVPVNDSAAFVPLSGETAMTGDLQTTGVICNDTGSDTVLIDLKRNSGDMLKVTAAPNVEVVQPLNLVLPDDSALPFRIMEGTNEYLRVATTDGAEQFTFKKGVTTQQVLTLSNDVTCSAAQDINIQNAAGVALRVMNAGPAGGSATELFRFNTNLTPNLADFSCEAKFDNNVEFNFSTLDVTANLNVELIQSSNAWDFMSDGDFALRFNTSAEQLITDFDFVNDNNDSVIQLGGTVASPLLKLVGDGSATFAGTVQVGDFTSSSTTTGGSIFFGEGGLYTQAAASTANNGQWFRMYYGDTITQATQVDGTILIGSGLSGGAPNITLNTDGSGEFASDILSGGNANAGDAGVRLFASGVAVSCNSSSALVYRGVATGSTVTTFGVRGSGNVQIGGDVDGNVPNISLNPDGSGIFTGDVELRESGVTALKLSKDTDGSSNLFGKLDLLGAANAANTVIRVYDGSGDKVAIAGDGSATFAGAVTVASLASGSNAYTMPSSSGTLALTSDIPSNIQSTSTSVTISQPATADSTLTMGGNLLPATSSIDIGTQSNKFNNIYVNQINDTGDLVVSGDIYLGNNALDTISMRAAISTSLTTTSSSNSIGSSTSPWGAIYTAKSVQAGIDSTSHSAHISLNEDGSMKLRNLTGLSQLTTSPTTGLMAMISNKLYIYIATGWKEVNLTAATPPS